MILIDLNQILLAGIIPQITNQKGVTVDENLVRHLVLNILRYNVKMFKEEYGAPVLCCDNRKYWRKAVFPHYKASRKTAREKSNLDWKFIFDTLGKIKEELKVYLPYKVLDIENAEADDIIGTLAPMLMQNENVLILSSDGDFVQLQAHNQILDVGYKIKQYNPSLKKYVVSDDPVTALKEKIITGDRGDGIPNILSPDNTFVEDQRQKTMTKDRLQKFLSEDFEKYDENSKIGFVRNRMLIDFEFIPQDIKENIIYTYDNMKPAPRGKLVEYFMTMKLKNLMEVIEEF
jgi:hypothetical protein